MRRPPWYGRYLTAEVVARTADGVVWRSYDAVRGGEVLLVSGSGLGDLRSGLDDANTAAAGPRPIETHLDDDPGWLVLPMDEVAVAVDLIGATGPRRHGWFATRWGWPHPYPRTAGQLGFRILTTLVGALVLVWGFTAVRWLLG